MASIHNLIFFKRCQNLIGGGSRITERGSTTTVSEMADNDFLTASRVNDVDIDISDGSRATRVDAIYIKYKGILSSYTATPTGGSGSAVMRAVPTEIDDFNGERVDLEVGDYKHDLHLLSTHFTATDVRVQLTGTNLEIVEIMLLSLFQEVDANESEIVSIDPVTEERTGQIDTESTGTISRSPSVGNARERRNLAMSLIVIPDETTITDVDEFVYGLEVNRRMVVGLPFTEDPTGVFPAVVSSRRIRVRYRGDFKKLGYQISFEIMEQ